MTARPASGTVQVLADRVEIDHLVLTDPSVVTATNRAREAGVDVANWLAAALRVGCLALDDRRTEGELARLESGMRTLADTVASSVGQSLTRLEVAIGGAVAPQGALAQASEHAVTRLATGVQALLTGDDARLPAHLRASVTAITDDSIKQVRTALADHAHQIHRAVEADRGSTAQTVQATLATHLDGVREGLTQLRADLLVQRETASQRSRTSLAGVPYEQAVLDRLEALANRAADGPLHRTGGTPGLDGRSKVGDAVVPLAGLPRPGLTLVVEAKHRTQRRFDVRAWRDEAARALAARGGQVFLGVTPPDCCPIPGQLVTILSPNEIVCGYDPDTDTDDLLSAVYLLLRVAALRASSPNAVDTTTVSAGLEELLRGLQPLEEIQKQGANAERAGKRVRELGSGLHAELRRRLDELLADLAGETAEDAPLDGAA